MIFTPHANQQLKEMQMIDLKNNHISLDTLILIKQLAQSIN